MIQHPGGRPKEIVLFNNRLVNVYGNFLEYETDAEPGSSGSPLFNTSWQVVGLHQAALLDEEVFPERKVKGYLGIRMDSILKDLQEQALTDSRLQDFFDKYVNRNTPPTQPQVFILSGRRRSFLENDAELEQQAMKNLGEAIDVEIKRQDPSVHVASISGRPQESHVDALKIAIQEINQQRNPEQREELAIELLTNRSKNPKTSPRGITLYYSAASFRAQQLVNHLQTILKDASPLPFIGAFPDSYTNKRRLSFCRELNLPAVVIYVGYLDNYDDRAYLESLQQDSAVGQSLASLLSTGILNALEDFKN